MTTNGHDARGRFAPGNPGGPGRPRRTVEFDYLKIMAEVVTPDDWRAVVKEALNRAKYGNPRAREWLAKYLIGASVLVRVAPGAVPAEPEPVANLDVDADDEFWDHLRMEDLDPAFEPQPPRISAS